MTRGSISLQLAVMFGMAAAATSLVVGGVAFLLLNGELERRARDEVRDRFSILERQIALDDGDADWAKRREMLEQFSPAEGLIRVYVLSPDPGFTYGAAEGVRVSFASSGPGFRSVALDRGRFLALSGPVPAKGSRPEVRLVVAADQGRRDDAAVWLGLVLVGAALAQVLIVSGLGWAIARRGLRPVDRLSGEAGRLRGEDPSLRLPTDRLPTELSGLVLAFNDALRRLEQSHQQLSDFNADVAHELRTPLTTLIGETELSLSRARDAEVLRATLQSNLEDLERLRLTISDMLLVARADAGEMAAGFVEVSLAAECARAADFMEVLLDEAESRAQVEGEARLPVDRGLLGRALTNLIDNAMRHGRPGLVRLVVEDGPEAARIRVISPGDPVPADHLPRLFDRFFSGDPARVSDGRSHGLGLAIVAAVARLHGGRVHVANGEGTVEVGLTLSRTAPSGIRSADA